MTEKRTEESKVEEVVKTAEVSTQTDKEIKEKKAKKPVARTTRKKTVKKEIPSEAEVNITAAKDSSAEKKKPTAKVSSAGKDKPAAKVSSAGNDKPAAKVSSAGNDKPAAKVSSAGNGKPTAKVSSAGNDKPAKNEKNPKKKDDSPKPRPKNVRKQRNQNKKIDKRELTEEEIKEQERLKEVERLINITNLNQMKIKELTNVCVAMLSEDDDPAKFKGLSHSDLIVEAFKLKSKAFKFSFIVGLLDPCEANNGNYGFLRLQGNNFATSNEDVYISGTQIKKFGLKKGDLIAGQVRERRDNEKHRGLVKIDAVNWHAPEETKRRKSFDTLVPTYPTEKFNIEVELDEKDRTDLTMRVVDLFTPIGKGQRGLIVAPPRTGKTTILQKIAKSIVKLHPEARLIVLLVDERPEEVTEMRETVPQAMVISSTFDETPEHHTQVSEMVISHAKRLVECGDDVVILLDSITRMTRAYNVAKEHSGKILSGGLDAFALRKPKQFFGAARNIRNGGSLTIMGTALISTGSRMDDVIYEEFKGTGNMEMVLDRALADRRMFPAIDINLSGTRREELLLQRNVLGKIFVLRKVLNDSSPVESAEMLHKRMKMSKSNDQFLNSLQIN